MAMQTANLLEGARTIAIIGLSDSKDRYSYEVAHYLQKSGFRVIPVNPYIKEVLGEKAYPDLLTIPESIVIDIVDVFRKSEEVMPHVMEAVKRGTIRAIWLQEGVINEAAKLYAESHEIPVYMNFCLMKAHKMQSSGNRG